MRQRRLLDRRPTLIHQSRAYRFVSTYCEAAARMTGGTWHGALNALQCESLDMMQFVVGNAQPRHRTLWARIAKHLRRKIRSCNSVDGVAKMTPVR